MKINKKWTTEEVNFLKEHYNNKGLLYCTERLNRTSGAISTRANLLKLYIHKETNSVNISIAQKKYQKNRLDSNFKVNVNQFLNIEKPEVAYFLGYFWADGYLMISRGELRLSIATEDMNVIKNVMDSLGDWNYNHRHRSITHKPITSAITSNRRLTDFMVENDYHLKSKVSADKILSKIPEHLKHYFFRGLVDGDGCISIKDDGRSHNLSISGSYDYDWSFLKHKCNDLKIKFKYYQTLNNNGNSSSIYLYGEQGKLFGDYIYSHYESDKIGLIRKYNKYLKSCELTIKKHDRLDYQNGRKQDAIKLYLGGIGISDIMRELSIAGTTIRRWLEPIKIEKVNVFKLKKEEMIKMINEGKRCIDIIKELSIGKTTYRRWLNEYKNTVTN